MTLTRIIRYSHWNSVIKYDEILSSVAFSIFKRSHKRWLVCNGIQHTKISSLLASALLTYSKPTNQGNIISSAHIERGTYSYTHFAYLAYSKIKPTREIWSMFNAQPMLMGIYPIQYSNISSDLYRVVGSLHTEEPHLARVEAQSEVITFLPLGGVI